MRKIIEQRAKDLERIKKFITWIESNRLFYVDEVRVWIKRMLNEEISFSKFVELFNEKVFDKYAHIAGATEAQDDWKRVEPTDQQLQEVVEKIAYEQYGAEQIDDLVAKMGILREFIQSKRLPSPPSNDKP